MDHRTEFLLELQGSKRPFDVTNLFETCEMVECQLKALGVKILGFYSFNDKARLTGTVKPWNEAIVFNGYTLGSLLTALLLAVGQLSRTPTKCSQLLYKSRCR